MIGLTIALASSLFLNTTENQIDFKEQRIDNLDTQLRFVIDRPDVRKFGDDDITFATAQANGRTVAYVDINKNGKLDRNEKGVSSKGILEFTYNLDGEKRKYWIQVEANPPGKGFTARSKTAIVGTFNDKKIIVADGNLNGKYNDFTDQISHNNGLGLVQLGQKTVSGKHLISFMTKNNGFLWEIKAEEIYTRPVKIICKKPRSKVLWLLRNDKLGVSLAVGNNFTSMLPDGDWTITNNTLTIPVALQQGKPATQVQFKNPNIGRQKFSISEDGDKLLKINYDHPKKMNAAVSFNNGNASIAAPILIGQHGEEYSVQPHNCPNQIRDKYLVKINSIVQKQETFITSMRYG